MDTHIAKTKNITHIPPNFPEWWLNGRICNIQIIELLTSSLVSSGTVFLHNVWPSSQSDTHNTLSDQCRLTQQTGWALQVKRSLSHIDCVIVTESETQQISQTVVCCYGYYYYLLLTPTSSLWHCYLTEHCRVVITSWYIFGLCQTTWEQAMFSDLYVINLLLSRLCSLAFCFFQFRMYDVLQKSLKQVWSLGTQNSGLWHRKVVCILLAACYLKTGYIS